MLHLKVITVQDPTGAPAVFPILVLTYLIRHITHLGFMVPLFHPIFGNFGWNHGTQVPCYTFVVSWFHGLGGTMEPQMCNMSIKAQINSIFRIHRLVLIDGSQVRILTQIASIKISRINQDGLGLGELKDGLQGNFKRTSLGQDDLEKYIFIHRKRSHAQSFLKYQCSKTQW